VSDPSTQTNSVRLMRFLLLFHLLVMAWSVVALWPTFLRTGGQSLLTVGRDLAFVALAIAIGMSSARLGAGLTLRSLDWAVHAIWNVLLLLSYLLRWGPFQFRLQPRAGSIEQLSLFNKLYPLLLVFPVLVLVVVYSGIPIGLSHFVQRLRRSAPSGHVTFARGASLASFAAAILFTLLVHHVWHLPEGFVGLAAGALLMVSFFSAAVTAARGDAVATRLLFCEAGAFALLRFI
jgi:hypothetical protein